MSLSDLRKNAQAELERITKEAERVSGGGGFERDPRYWKPVLDAAGNGSAVIRFLPRPDGEDFPFIQKFTYSIKGPGGRWYIENSPATIELPCPANERWQALWNEGTPEAKERAKVYKRRIAYVANILVIKHTGKPDDEGKVFLYEFGKKIYDKLADKMNPVDDAPRFNPFDLDSGANFRLRIMKKDGFTNYDKSEFDVPGPLADDATMEKVWRQCHSLRAELAPNKFKPYDELKRKLEQVMGEAAVAKPRAANDGDNTPPWHEAVSAAQQAEKPAAPDDLDWFKKMAQNS